MKVLLINPSHRGVAGYLREGTTQVFPPVGLAYIAAVLEKNGIDVSMLDVHALDLASPEIKQHIERESPDIVGITSVTITMENMYAIARMVKEMGDIPVVAGGPHPAVMPAQTLEDGPVDIVVRGEGEYTFLELVKSIAAGNDLAGVQGISYQKDGELIHNPDRALLQDLDSLPYPARHLLPLDRYYSPGARKLPFATILTSRGCPYRCNFCVSRAIHGTKFRVRSVENIMGEILHLKEAYGVKEIEVLDDIFAFDSRMAEEFCRRMVENHIPCIWRLGNGVRVDGISQLLLRRFREAGCYYVAFGVEAGSQQILDNMKKRIKLEQVKDAVRWGKEAGLVTMAFFLLGNLGENRATMEETIRFAIELDPDMAQFNITIPFPGTEYHDIIQQRGRLLAKSWSEYSAYGEPVFAIDEITPELLKEMQKTAYRRFYMRRSLFLKRAFGIRSLNEARVLVKGGWSIIKMSLGWK